MAMVEFSFICPTNNMEMFETNVSASLEKQSFRDYELICVDTQKKHFSAAADALNYGASQASGEYLVFLHHDIVIEDTEYLTKMHDFCKKNNFLIAGAAGVLRAPVLPQLRSKIYSNIVDGPEKRGFLPVDINSVTAAEAVDECFFVIPREVFEKRPFNHFFDTWHLYAVEYSLWAKEQGDNTVVILPFTLWHLSDGASVNQNYFDALNALRKIYRKPIICTMCFFPKNELLFRLRIIYLKLYLFYHFKRRIT